MRVVTATRDNLDAVCAVAAECRRSLEAQGILQWDDGYPSRSFFRDAIAAGNVHVLRVDDDDIAGITVLDGQQPAEWAAATWNHQDGPFLVIHAFAISPRVQRRGHGNFLLAFCEDVARKRGCESIRIDAFSENPGALRFWEQHGYRFRGQVRFASKPAGHQRYCCYEKSLMHSAGSR